MTLVLIASQPNGTLQDQAGNANSGGAKGTAEFRQLNGTAPNHFDGTLVTHYADAAGTGPLTTPIVADSRGRLMRWIASGSYKQIVNGESIDFHATPGSVENSIAKLNSALEFNVRDSDLFSGLYPNGGGGTDSTVGLQAAIDYVSAQAAARGQRKARLYGFNGALYQVGQLVPKSNVEMIGDGATLMARANIASSGAMLRNADALADLIAAVAVGTATTTNGSYELTALSSISSYYEEMKITGTNIPAGTKVAEVDVLNGKVIMDAPATGTGSGITITRAATHYGRCDNFSLIDWTLDPNGFDTGSVMRLLYTRNLLLDGVTAFDRSSSAASWLFQLGGRNGKVRACAGLEGALITHDGIHIEHGQYWEADGNYIESGDDCYVVGGENGDASLLRDPDPIRHVTFTGNVAHALRGAAFAAYVLNGATGRDWEVTDVTVDGLTGRAGVLRNAPFKVTDLNLGAVGSAQQIKDVGIHNVKLRGGSTSHDETNHYGLNAQSVSGLTLNDVKLTLAQKVAPGTAYTVWRAIDCDDVSLRGCRESVSAGPYTLSDFSRSNVYVD